jgi:hypothetical protein
MHTYQDSFPQFDRDVLDHSKVLFDTHQCICEAFKEYYEAMRQY